MPITAETFELEHFEKLERGIGVAKQAYAALVNDLEHEADARADLRAHTDDLEDKLRERPTMEQWNGVMQFIVDVERGIRSVEELFVFAREQNG